MTKEILTKFYDKYRMLIFPIIISLSSLFLIIFVIYPQASKLITNQAREGDLLNKSKILEAKASALENYNVDDLSRKLNDTLRVYPQDKDLANVVGLLQQLTGQSGFTITSVTVAGGAQKGQTGSGYDINLVATGAKPLVLILLSNLENSPRLLQINSIDINLSNQQQLADVSLGLTVLYSPLPQNLGSIDVPLPQLSTQDEALLTKLASVNRSSPSVSLSTSNVSNAPRGKTNPFE